MINDVQLIKECKYRLSCGWCELRNIECPQSTQPSLHPYLSPTITEPIHIKDHAVGFEYNCCKNCSNNPANGGSGICNCTLPYFEQNSTTVLTTVTSLSAEDTSISGAKNLIDDPDLISGENVEWT